MLFYGISGAPGIGHPVGFSGLGDQASDCAAYSDDNSCNSDPNCTMGTSGCIPYTGASGGGCAAYSDIDSCNAQNACAWGNGNCVPYSGDCSGYTDMGTCNAQNACAWGNGNCVPYSGPSATGAPAKKGATSQGGGTPWWATFTSAAAQGITAGALQPKTPLAKAQSFLTSPLGIGVLAVGIVALVLVLRK